MGLSALCSARCGAVDRGPLVLLAVAMTVLSGLTGSASGGMAITPDALGSICMKPAAEHRIDPLLMHRVVVIGSGTLGSLSQNGAVLTVPSISGLTHRESYLDIMMTAIIDMLIALVVVIVLGSLFGSLSRWTKHQGEW